MERKVPLPLAPVLEEEDEPEEPTAVPLPLESVVPSPHTYRSRYPKMESHWLQQLFIKGYFVVQMEECKKKYDIDLLRRKLGRWHLPGCSRFVCFTICVHISLINIYLLQFSDGLPSLS